MIYLGTDYGGWHINPSVLNFNSVIYSAGLGTDISFDLELIKKFNVKVHGFDPTPRSLRWIKKQTIPEQFIVHDYGLSNQDGYVNFLAPEKEEYVSYKEINDDTGIILPVKKLKTIMTELKHYSIDILKMDIEGSEYKVIDDMFNDEIYPIQLLIEFHNPHIIQHYINKIKNHQYVQTANKNYDFCFIRDY